MISHLGSGWLPGSWKQLLLAAWCQGGKMVSCTWGSIWASDSESYHLVVTGILGLEWAPRRSTLHLLYHPSAFPNTTLTITISFWNWSCVASLLFWNIYHLFSISSFTTSMFPPQGCDNLDNKMFKKLTCFLSYQLDNLAMGQQTRLRLPALQDWLDDHF